MRTRNSDRAIEWLSAMCMLGWAVVLAQTGDTLASTNLRELLRYGLTEEKIAAVFALVGAARVVALYINGRWPRSPIVRMAGAGVGVLMWGQVSFMLFAGGWLQTGIASTGVVVYAALALADVLSVYRAAFDARYHSR